MLDTLETPIFSKENWGFCFMVLLMGATQGQHSLAGFDTEVYCAAGQVAKKALKGVWSFAQ